jgi:DNA-binding NtrC family response regulator
VAKARRPSAAAALWPHGVTVKTERQLILATLDHFEGDKKKVASALKISLKTLYARLSGYKARTD